MDFSITPEQERLRKEVIQFAHQSLSCDMIKHDREAIFNRDAWQKCGEFGVQGWLIPTNYGGKGFDILTAIYGMQALGYSCKDNGFLFGMNAHIWACEMPLLAFGSDAQKEKYLPLLASGQWIASHSATEPQAGSDIFNLKTTAQKKDDKYILNGAKHYVTNGAVADLFIVFASVDLALGEKGLTVFLIEKNTPGLVVTPVISTMGDRTAQVTRLKLENCEVPVSHRLGAEGAGMTIFSHSMEWERGFILGTAVGTMERILEKSMEYARKHKQFGQSISKFQLVSTKLVDMKISK
ncbi:MAG: acyl-CoA dehydrogenase family protein [Pseudomonadota bacterium]